MGKDKKPTLEKKDDEMPVEKKDMTKKEFDWLKAVLVGATKELKEASRETREVISNQDKRIKKSCDKNDKVLFALKTQMEEFNRKMEHFEESLLFIMHNIKKNQFLYAHYPDDWVKEYLDVRDGVKFENDYMDKKVKKKKAS